jgi:hypothetical protein
MRHYHHFKILKIFLSIILFPIGLVVWLFAYDTVPINQTIIKDTSVKKESIGVYDKQKQQKWVKWLNISGWVCVAISLIIWVFFLIIFCILCTGEWTHGGFVVWSYFTYIYLIIQFPFTLVSIPFLTYKFYKKLQV